MNRIRRGALLALSLVLALCLSACGGERPDLPMELTVDSHTIVLGRTTTGDLADWGWSVHLIAPRDNLTEETQYVTCDFRIDKGEGSRFSVAVLVPFQRNFVGPDQVDLIEEARLSLTQGVVSEVTVDKAAAGQFRISYDGVDCRALTWDDAGAWGARRARGAAADAPVYTLEAARGALTFAGDWDALARFTVALSLEAFSALQG